MFRFYLKSCVIHSTAQVARRDVTTVFSMDKSLVAHLCTAVSNTSALMLREDRSNPQAFVVVLMSTVHLVPKLVKVSRSYLPVATMRYPNGTGG